MAIEITPKQQELVDVIFQTGGFESESKVLSSALELLQHKRHLLSEANAGVSALNTDEFTEYGEADRSRFRIDIVAAATSRREVT